jgi:hypothetical protein
MEQRRFQAIVERTSNLLEGDSSGSSYGVVRLGGHQATNAAHNGACYALAQMGNLAGSEILLMDTQLIPIPAPLEIDQALLAPPLALALRVWEQLHLEMGEAAVYTDGNVFSNFVGQVAIWRGGCPVMKLLRDANESVPDRVERIGLKTDSDETVGRIKNRIKEKAGFAAVDLSGRPEIIDLLLEVMPRWGKLMIAGRTQRSLTIDFYNNVHRKGLVLSCGTFDPSTIFDKREESKAYLDAAFRILENKAMAAICSGLTGFQSSGHE